MTLTGTLTYRNRPFKYIVYLRELTDKSILRGFYYEIYNDAGKKRQGVWLYLEKSLTESIIALIHMPKGFGEK